MNHKTIDHTLAARLAERSGELADIQARPHCCRNPKREDELKTEIRRIRKQLEEGPLRAEK